MNRSLVILVAMSAALPIGVQMPGSDSSSTSSSTRFRAAGGGGQYVFLARGCEGQVIDEVPSHFRDASVSLEQRFGGTPLVVGARGGWIRDQIDTSSSGRFVTVPVGQTVYNRYVNPYVQFDPGPGAIGFGVVFHEREFLTAGEGAREQTNHDVNDVSVHFRAGRLDRKYFLAQWMESEPLYSGGGYLTVGVGGRTDNQLLDLFAGLSTGGPYEGAGLMLRGSLRLGAGARLNAAGRVGGSSESGAYGGSVGFEVRLPAAPD